MSFVTGAGEAPGAAKSPLLRPSGKPGDAQRKPSLWYATALITASRARGKPRLGDCIHAEGGRMPVTS